MGAFNYFKPLGKSWWILRIFLDRIGIKVSHKLIDFIFQGFSFSLRSQVIILVMSHCWNS